MGWAAELLLDDHSTRLISESRDRLIGLGVRGLELGYEFHPHITLGYFEDCAAELQNTFLAEFAAVQRSFRLSLGYMGVFPGAHTGVLFIGAVPSSELLDAHAAALRLLDGVAARIGDHCNPGRLVPHVTLGDNVPMDLIGKALHVISENHIFDLPICGVADRAAIQYESGAMLTRELLPITLEPGLANGLDLLVTDRPVNGIAR